MPDSLSEAGSSFAREAAQGIARAAKTAHSAAAVSGKAAAVGGVSVGVKIAGGVVAIVAAASVAIGGGTYAAKHWGSHASKNDPAALVAQASGQSAPASAAASSQQEASAKASDAAPQKAAAPQAQELVGIQKLTDFTAPLAVLPDKNGMVPVIVSFVHTRSAYEMSYRNGEVPRVTTYQIAYDDEYRPLQVTANGKPEVTYQYDGHKRLVKRWGPLQHERYFSYDDQGRLKRIAYDASYGSKPVEFAYDSQGRLVSAGSDFYRYAGNDELPSTYTWGDWDHSRTYPLRFDDKNRPLGAAVPTMDYGGFDRLAYGEGTTVFVKGSLDPSLAPLPSDDSYDESRSVITDKNGRVATFELEDPAHYPVEYDEYGNIVSLTFCPCWEEVEEPRKEDLIEKITIEYKMVPISEVYQGYVPAVNFGKACLDGISFSYWEGPLPKLFELISTEHCQWAWSTTWSQCMLQRR